jgi:hypothetical protein
MLPIPGSDSSTQHASGNSSREIGCTARFCSHASNGCPPFLLTTPGSVIDVRTVVTRFVIIVSNTILRLYSVCSDLSRPKSDIFRVGYCEYIVLIPNEFKS